MFLQIADRVQSKPLRFIAPHDERISVVKPERLGDSDAQLRERVANFLERQPTVCFQNLLSDRAGIFRIGVNLCAAQCFPKNDRAALRNSETKASAGFSRRSTIEPC